VKKSRKFSRKIALVFGVLLTACSSASTGSPQTSVAPAVFPVDPVLLSGAPDSQVLRSAHSPSLYAAPCHVPGALRLGESWSLADESVSLAADGTLVLDTLKIPGLDGYGFDLSVVHEGKDETPMTVQVRCLPEKFPKITIEGTFTDWLMLTTVPNPFMPGQAGSFQLILEPNGFLAYVRGGAWMAADFFRDGDRVVGFQKVVLPPGQSEVQSYSNTPGLGFQSSTKTVNELSIAPDEQWVPVGKFGLGAHAAAVLPNGNLLGIVYEEMPDTPMDADKVIESSSTTKLCPRRAPTGSDPVLRGRVVEVTNSGRIVHSWRTEEHLPSAVRAPLWVAVHSFTGAKPYCAVDAEHLNSLAFYQDENSSPGKGTVMVTGRHMDGAFLINWPSGEVVWSLGGNVTDKSLTIQGDPLNGLSLPHDAHFLSGDEVMVFDNRKFGEHSRVVVYRVDTGARSATLQETYTVDCPDSKGNFSFCGAFVMGSARLTSNAAGVLVGVGSSQVTAAEIPRITADEPARKPTATLMLSGSWSYRVLPAAPFDSLDLYRLQFPSGS